MNFVPWDIFSHLPVLVRFWKCVMMGEGTGRRGAFISILLFPLPLMMIDMIGCLKVCETAKVSSLQTCDFQLKDP